MAKSTAKSAGKQASNKDVNQSTKTKVKAGQDNKKKQTPNKSLGARSLIPVQTTHKASRNDDELVRK